MALTIADYAASPKMLVAGVAKTMLEDSPFLDRLPIEDVGTLSIKVLRQTPNPNIPSWRRMGQGHGSIASVKPDEVEEQAYSIGNEITVDKALYRDKSVRLYDPMTEYTQQVARNIARTITNTAINGTPANPDAPVGLRWRVMNDLPASQNITADPAGGVAGLDISPDTTNPNAAQQYFAHLDAMLLAVSGSLSGAGKNMFFLTNDTLIARHTHLCRQSGMLKTTTDSLNRVFPEWAGVPFIDMGRMPDDVTRVIGNTETLDGTATTGGSATGLYLVKFGKEYFTGWQEYSMEISEPELDADKVTYRSVIDWVMGFALTHPRSVARSFGLIVV